VCGGDTPRPLASARGATHSVGEDIAFGGGDLEGAVGLAGDRVAAFFEAVVFFAARATVALFGQPAPGGGSGVVDLAPGDWHLTAGPETRIKAQLDAEPCEAGKEPLGTAHIDRDASRVLHDSSPFGDQEVGERRAGVEAVAVEVVTLVRVDVDGSGIGAAIPAQHLLVSLLRPHHVVNGVDRYRLVRVVQRVGEDLLERRLSLSPCSDPKRLWSVQPLEKWSCTRLASRSRCAGSGRGSGPS